MALPHRSRDTIQALMLRSKPTFPFQRISQPARPLSTPAKPPEINDPTSRSTAPSQSPAVDVSALLATPTWSLATHLPPLPTPGDGTAPTEPAMSREKLRHLLRLAALEPPAPDSPDEAALLRTLDAQLHFVRQVQAVQVPAGVEPLRAVRDESARGKAEAVVGLETAGIQEALGKEVWKGKYWRRVRRGGEARAIEDEPVGLAEGREFVVDRGEGADG